MGHVWHSDSSSNFTALEDDFLGFEYVDRYQGACEVKNVVFVNETFSDETKARAEVTDRSYHSGSNRSAYITIVNPDKKTSKGYQTALKNFIDKRNDYRDFRKNLDMTYGRNGKTVGCPTCGSSFNIKYMKGKMYCPICGSGDVISKTNRDNLDRKRRLMKEASDKLQVQCDKLGIYFICGVEWRER